ncbi:MAG: hypothetical protein WC473_02225 [Patescibacteria group bacterium]
MKNKQWQYLISLVITYLSNFKQKNFNQEVIKYCQLTFFHIYDTI